MSQLLVLLVEGNPCYEKEDRAARVKFLARLAPFFNPLSLSLEVLNGIELTIAERCESFEEERPFRFNVAQMDAYRLRLAMRKSGVPNANACLKLDASNCGFLSLSALAPLRWLRVLDASNNELTRVEPGSS